MSIPTADTATDLDGLATWFRHFGEHEVPRSALYQRLCAIVADTPELVALVFHAAPTQRRPNLFLAACHASLLRDGSHELARWYPTVSRGAVDPGDPGDPNLATTLLDFCASRHEELVELITNGATQTNEVGRSAVLLPALHAIAQSVERQPLALLEVGASAGLNLRVDRYGFAYSDGRTVHPDAALVLACDTTRSREPLPHDLSVPEIAFRAGLDLNPLDLADDRDVRWLLALIWPDETERFERTRAAIEAGREVPVTLRQGDAVDGVAELVASTPSGLHPVVLTSWVLTYLEPDRRRAFVREIERLGGSRDLSWVAMEHQIYAPELLWPREVIDKAANIGNPLLVHSWRNGIRTSQWLATVHPHGRWLDWHPNRAPLF